MKTIRCFTAAVCLLTVAVAVAAEGPATPNAVPERPGGADAVRPELLDDLLSEQDRATARRLDGPLRDLLAASLIEHTPRIDVREFLFLGQLPYAERFLTMGGAAIVDVTVIGDIDQAAAAMRRIDGVTVTGAASAPAYGLVSAAVESDRLLDVAGIAGVRALHASSAVSSRGPLRRPGDEAHRLTAERASAPAAHLGAKSPQGEQPGPLPGQGDGETGSAGAVGNQAEQALDVDLARAVYGSAVDGYGVRIGTISDSVNQVNSGPDTNCGGSDCVGIDESQFTGDLPGDSYIAVVQDGPADSNDEGRAMMELMYDIAPGVSRLGFATAEGGQAVFANNVGDLRNAGMDIITDDVWYLFEPFYQDGVIAQAIVNYINNGGIYFSSAGNRGNISYEAVWRDDDNDGYYDFAPGDDTQQITVLRNCSPTIMLEWSQPWGNATTDLMMELRSETGAVWYESFERNVGGDPADQLVYLAAQSGAINQIAIRLKEGSADGLTFKYYPTSTWDIRMDEYTANTAGTIDPHAGNAQNMAIAAAPFYDRGTAQDYSSRGPHRRIFAADGTSSPLLIDKPDFLSIDDCNTTFFGADIPEDTDSYPNFGGTSAAAPNAAAVAALMLQVAGGPGSLDQEDVRHILKTTAVDLGASGHDTTYGHGRIHALAAVAGAIGPESAEYALYPNQFGVARLDQNLYDITDVDRIEYAFDDAGSVTVDVQESDSIDPMVLIHRQVAGDLVAADYDSGSDGDDARVTYDAGYWTIYQAKVLSEELFADGDPYTIAIDGPDAVPVDLAIDPATMTGSASYAIDTAGDLDYFRVIVPSVPNLTRMRANLAPTGHDGIVLVFDAAGNELGRADNGGTGAPEELLLDGFTAGQELVMAVASYAYSGSGAYTLTASFLPDNDQCANHISIGNGSHSFATTGATTDGPGDCSTNQDIWYAYQAECTGLMTASLCGSMYDTHLSVYLGGTCPPTEVIGCNDDSCGLQSELTLDAVYGNEYLIRVGGYGTYTGTGTLTVDCRPANDACAEATSLSVPAVQPGSTLGADADGAPMCGVSNNSPGVWYRITGTGHTITASTCDAGTSYDTKLSVYCDSCDTPACVDGNDDDQACGSNTYHSSVSFCSRLNETYYILVHGFNGASGDFVLHIEDDGAACSGAAQCGAPRGACCDPEGYCIEDVTEAECLLTPGSRFAGDGTTCGTADADSDGVLDTCDECPNEPALVFPSEPGGEQTCGDGIDNDCDGATDLADSDCQPTCTYTCGDIEGDSDVDLADFARFARCFGASPVLEAACVCCDLNGDLQIDPGDFAIFAGLMGQGSSHTPPNCP